MTSEFGKDSGLTAEEKINKAQQLLLLAKTALKNNPAYKDASANLTLGDPRVTSDNGIIFENKEQLFRIINKAYGPTQTHFGISMLKRSKFQGSNIFMGGFSLVVSYEKNNIVGAEITYIESDGRASRVNTALADNKIREFIRKLEWRM